MLIYELDIACCFSVLKFIMFYNDIQPESKTVSVLYAQGRF